MANASVEISWIEFAGSVNAPIFGKCVRQETLAISGTTATQSVAVSSSEIGPSFGQAIVRVCTDDTACYVAAGTTPDPTATSATANSTARRYVPAGGETVLHLSVGEKVAVKAVS